MRISIVSARRHHGVDAIATYADCLTEGLAQLSGVEPVHLRLDEALASTDDVVILQYNPFSWGRWGVAPKLMLWALQFRLSPRHRRLVLMVHEPFVAVDGFRSAAMAAWQQPQLLVLRWCAHVVLVPSSDAARRCRSWPRRPRVVPVGSNVPDQRSARAEARVAIGADDATVVLAALAASPAGRVTELLTDAAAAVSRSGASRCILLMLGVGNEVPGGLPREVETLRPGLLDEVDVARMLSAADIFLAPYVDGVSTRRGSLMAALQHALPVVGTDVGRSDGVLISSEAIVTVAPGDRQAFASAVARLAGDPPERSYRGASARRLYEAEFAWDVIARQTVAAVASE